MEPLNGDGFGVGWYAQELDPIPCVLTSMRPAWANRNLKRISEKIRSTCVFAHVRAATDGSAVTELNCHPFQNDEFLWMHIVASRYVSTEDEEPQSLYVAQGTRFEVHDGRYRMVKSNGRNEAVIVASEPLTDVEEDWELVPRNHMVTVSPELQVQLRPL